MKISSKLVYLASIFGMLLTTNVYAQLMDTVPTIGETGSFSDGAGGDYFGLVTNAGTPMIAGVNIVLWQISAPPTDSVAGRDHDDGNTLPATRTATWEILLPIGTISVENLDFSGTLSAADTGSNWVNDPGSITLELKIDGATQVTQSYTPLGDNSALALNGTAPTVPATGLAVNLSMAASTPATMSVQLVVTAGSSSGNENWSLSGTLTTDNTLPVELQSFSID